MAGDVLTHFNDVAIADDGTFLFREAVRINFGHLVSQAFNGEVATVSCRAVYKWVVDGQRNKQSRYHLDARGL